MLLHLTFKPLSGWAGERNKFTIASYLSRLDSCL
uniref:Uncharacterized protein n=1 Tax=Rhizophora mucronata TaxID=61149 RepID=A0A2P2NXV4_RHIMU